MYNVSHSKGMPMFSSKRLNDSNKNPNKRFTFFRAAQSTKCTLSLKNPMNLENHFYQKFAKLEVSFFCLF